MVQEESANFSVTRRVTDPNGKAKAMILFPPQSGLLIRAPDARALPIVRINQSLSPLSTLLLSSKSWFS